MTLPKFTISILCCNRLELTQACLASVVTHSGVDYEVIITDNGSTDGTAEWLTKFTARRPFCRVVTNAENRGFIPPNNHALELARGEFFVCLNNDMTVCDGWLERLCEPFSDPLMGVTGVAGACGTISDRLIGTRGNRLDYIEGSCLMVPTSLARKHGLFPDYLRFIYWEDTALSLRLRELGYKIATVPLAMQHNKPSQTIKAVLSPEEIKGHMDHNTEAMKQRWGFYFKRKAFDRRILVRRLGAHGDVLLATPALWELRQKFPQAVIDVVTKCPSMLQGLPWLGFALRNRSWYDEFYDLDLAYEKRPEVHIVSAFADTLGVTLPKQWQMHMHCDVENATWAERTSRGAKLALIHAGPSCWPGKNWPADRWQEVVTALKGQDYFTAAVGATDSPSVGCDLNLAGSTTPQQLYALCNHSRLFVGIDSMPQHVASTANCPSVVLFGPTNPRAIIRPTPRIIPVYGDVAKVPCIGEHGRRTVAVTQCPCEGACMEAITVAQVLKAVARVEMVTA